MIIPLHLMIKNGTLKNIPTSTFDEDQRTRIEREYFGLQGIRSRKCALRHYSKTKPIFDNARPTQTDIKETIKQQTNERLVFI